jgi:hypothetical protein
MLQYDCLFLAGYNQLYFFSLNQLIFANIEDPVVTFLSNQPITESRTKRVESSLEPNLIVVIYRHRNFEMVVYVVDGFGLILNDQFN